MTLSQFLSIRANDQDGMTKLKEVRRALVDKQKEEADLDGAIAKCKHQLLLLTEDKDSSMYLNTYHFL